MGKIRRFGSVIGIKPDMIEEYEKLHDHTNPGVRKLLGEAHIRNFSIYIQQFENGEFYLFRYFEYTGDNYESDMAKMAEQSEIISWLSVTDPMQITFTGESTWTEMEQVYFNI